MKCRKKKPTALKVIQGTVDPSRTNYKEPFPEVFLPDPPGYMKGTALEEWHRVSQEMYDLGMLTSLDRAVLEAYCVAYGRWVDAEDKVSKETLVLKSKDGQPYQNPFLGIANTAWKLVLKAASELGLSPTSRSRIAANPPQKEVNKWAKK